VRNYWKTYFYQNWVIILDQIGLWSSSSFLPILKFLKVDYSLNGSSKGVLVRLEDNVRVRSWWIRSCGLNWLQGSFSSGIQEAFFKVRRNNKGISRITVTRFLVEEQGEDRLSQSEVELVDCVEVRSNSPKQRQVKKGSRIKSFWIVLRIVFRGICALL
jgi:hypothetical protein